jgi:hypothetical protein
MRYVHTLLTEKAVRIGTLFLVVKQVLIYTDGYLAQLVPLLSGKMIVEVEK